MQAVHLDTWQKCLNFVELHAVVVWYRCYGNVVGVYVLALRGTYCLSLEVDLYCVRILVLHKKSIFTSKTEVKPQCRCVIVNNGV